MPPDVTGKACYPERSMTLVETQECFANYDALVAFWHDICGLSEDRAKALIDQDVRSFLRIEALNHGEPTPVEEARRIHEQLRHLVDGITTHSS